jgi:hypothetical protein
MRLFGKDKGPPSAELVFFSRYSILADGCLGGSGKLWRSINRLPTPNPEAHCGFVHRAVASAGGTKRVLFSRHFPPPG